MQHVAVGGLEPTPLGRAEPLVGQAEAADDIEGVAHAMQLFLEVGGEGADRRDAAFVWTHGAKRVSKEPALLLLALGQVQGVDQCQGLAPCKAVSLDGFAHRLLLLGLKPAEHVRQGHADGAGIDPPGHLVAELLGQGQTHAHPA